MEGERPGCATCGGPLKGRQRRFCGLACKNRDTNNRHQNYLAQQQRGLSRKLAAMIERGMRCARCGYSRNWAAMVWHHVDPATKRFDLDLRAFSNRSVAELRIEIARCELLCANCHAEEHNPAAALPQTMRSTGDIERQAGGCGLPNPKNDKPA